MHPVVILAGGLGTRVAHLTGTEIPKVMLPVAGRPFIDAKLESLVAAGVTDVLMLVAHGAPAIEQHVGTGGRFGLSVDYLEDGPELLGTGGAVRRALAFLPDLFWVTYGDTLLEVPMGQIEDELDPRRIDGVMTVLHNRDRWETSNVSVDNGFVIAFAKGCPPGTHEYIDYGMLLFSSAAFADTPAGPFDLAVVIDSLIERRRLGAFVVSEQFRDIGTEERWRETDRFLRARARKGERHTPDESRP